MGQGLAGTCLALRLWEEEIPFRIIDKGHESAASHVAAGLYNPITGKKMTLTWLADELFPELNKFYRRAEHILKESFFHEKPIYRPFLNYTEQNTWMGQSAEPRYADYIGAINDTSIVDDVKNSFGGITLKNAGFVDTAKFIAAARQFFIENELLISKAFDYSQLNIANEGVDFQGLQAEKIIFAEGNGVATNDLFNWLPFRPVKGEILYIKMQKSLSAIINRGVFVIPLGAQLYKVGATYNWKDLSDSTTNEARTELVNKLEALIEAPYDIVAQVSGVRPATKDRRPIIGHHPEYKNVWILNGLGAKGVSLAPFFSKMLLESINGSEVMPEVNISRFYALYHQS